VGRKSLRVVSTSPPTEIMCFDSKQWSYDKNENKITWGI
jgi:hypothetical protein